jgi:hypothetical protein
LNLNLNWIIAGLEGFRLIGRKTYSFYAWCLFLIVGLAIVFLLALIFGKNGPFQTDLNTTAPIWIAIYTVIAAMIFSTIVCAIYRAELRPRQIKFAYIRFGYDELRLMAFLIVVTAIWFGMAFAAKQSGPFFIIVILSTVALYTPVTLIGPAIFARKKFALAEGWALAKDRYKALLVMNATAGAGFIAVAMLSKFIYQIYMKAHEAELMRATSDYRGVMAISAPAILIAMVGYVAAIVILTAPAAAVFRELTASTDIDPDVFG